MKYSSSCSQTAGLDPQSMVAFSETKGPSSVLRLRSLSVAAASTICHVFLQLPA